MKNKNQLFNPSVINTLLNQKNENNTKDLQKILLNFLEVLDSLDRLIKISETGKLKYSTSDKNWLFHLQTLRRQLLDAFSSTGVTFLNSVGLSFDPQRHEAVETVQNNEYENNIVIEELSRGCMWRGEMLRFARVIIVKNKD